MIASVKFGEVVMHVESSVDWATDIPVIDSIELLHLVVVRSSLYAKAEEPAAAYGRRDLYFTSQIELLASGWAYRR